MKPQDLYRGQAPAAMGMMGQGLMEAGANIGRTLQSGYQALGQGIGAGIGQAAGAVAGAYQEKKKLDAQNKADEGFVKTMLPYMPESIRNDFAARHEDLMSDPSASALDKSAFYHSAKSYLGQSVAHTMDMEKIREQAAYNPAWMTAPAQIEEAQAAAELKRLQAEAIKRGPADQAKRDAERAGIFKNMMDALRGGSAAPAAAPTQTGPIQSATSYEKLTPDVQAMVNSSGLGAEAWNSLDESQREANLANAHLPNFGLPAFKPKKR
jgi:hypothetical protein